ncbi:hypothetical protein J537_2755 [Acinetobacter baumannii 1437282]|nr:hypothetical protein J537_2755 [Acinetobacter baumannii 1437282]
MGGSNSMINERLKNIFEILDEMQSLISQYLDSLKASDANYEEYEILNRFNKSVIPNFRITINTYSSLFENEIFFETVINDLESIAGSFRYNVMNLDELEAHQTLSNMVNSARNIQEIKKDLQMMRVTNLRFEELMEPAIDKALDQIKSKVDKVDAAILAIEQHETDKIYLGLSKKYQWEYFRNNSYFFITLIIVGYVSWYYSASLEQISNLTNGVLIAFIAFKILLISIAITLITLFLRRSSHAKKLQDQAYQTHVEISAFPIHVRSLKEDDQHSLVKELAMKYFGKELDHSQTDKAGELMAEQIRMSTEMVKASAEMVKSVKPESSK